MATMNKVDLLDCAAGHHNFQDDGEECSVCGHQACDAALRVITVYAVTTCIPDRGEAPCMPDVFATEAEAVAFLEKMLANEWGSHGREDEETGERLPYPGNWQEAQEKILAGFTDGSWGQWQLTSHTVSVPI